MDPLTGQDARTKKAQKLLESAQLLLDNGHYNDSISRAYYAVFHISAALLAVKRGVVKERWEHAELHKELLDNFCKRGFLLNRKNGTTFAELSGRRNEADYEMKTFTGKQAEKLLADVREFVEKLKGVL